MLIFLSFIIAVNALCNCARYVSHRGSTETLITRRLAGCEDHEVQTECQRAEWEMVDYVNGVMNFARTLIQAHPSLDGELLSGLEVDARNMEELSLALEKHRPVPDCSTGLFTTTPANFLKDRSILEPLWDEHYDDDDDVMEDLCVSKEILEECEDARDSISEYVSNVIKQIKESPKTSETFKIILQRRLKESILPTISCETTHHVRIKAERNNATTISLQTGIVLLTIFMSI